jgi:hypothetical protein
MVNTMPKGTSRIWFVAGFAMVILALAAAMPQKAGAYSAEQILAPHYNAVALYQRALGAINHQSSRRLYQLDGDIEHLVRCLNQGVGWARTRLNEEISKRIKVNDKFKQGYNTLQVEAGKAWVPHIGWLDRNSNQQRYQNENKAVKAIKDQVRLKTQGFWVPTIGWINEKALNQRIADKRKERQAIADQKYRGEYGIHFPGIGWVNRKQLRGRIEAEEKTIQTITAQINSGNYKVHLPHLGWVTRKVLIERIAAVKKQTKALQKSFNGGNAKLHRPYVGWAAQNAVKQRAEAQQKASWDLDKQVNAGDYKAHLPTLGMVNRKQVAQKINALDADRKKVESSMRANTYAAPVKGFGMMNNQQITARLKAGNLTKTQQNELNQGRARISNTYGIDLQVRGAYLNQLRHYQSQLNSAAIVQKAWLNNNIKHLNLIIQEEFSRERRYNLMRLKNQLAFLEQSLLLIPSKVPPRPKKK